MKKMFTLFLSLVMALGLGIPAHAVYDAPSFTDVPKNHWAYTYVEQAVEEGWVRGLGDGTFAPDANATYAELCAMLVNAFFPEEAASCPKGSGCWFEPYCTAAQDLGILDGSAVAERCTDPAAVGRSVTCREAASILRSALLAQGCEPAEGKEPQNADQFMTRAVAVVYLIQASQYFEAAQN